MNRSAITITAILVTVLAAGGLAVPAKAAPMPVMTSNAIHQPRR